MVRMEGAVLAETMLGAHELHEGVGAGHVGIVLVQLLDEIGVGNHHKLGTADGYPEDRAAHAHTVRDEPVRIDLDPRRMAQKRQRQPRARRLAAGPRGSAPAGVGYPAHEGPDGQRQEQRQDEFARDFHCPELGKKKAR